MKSISWFLDHFEEATSAALIFLMAIFAFLNVISRYVIHLPLNFTEELNVYLFVWLAFLGSAYGVKTGAHMAVTLIYDHLPNGIRKALYITLQVVTVIFIATLGYCGWLEVKDEIALNAMTETLNVPVWWFTSSIPIGSGLMLFRVFQKTLSDLKDGAY